MTGRHLCSDAEAARRGFADRPAALRRQVLRETIAAFEAARPRDHFARAAERNLARWRHDSHTSVQGMQIKVIAGDWGNVTQDLTRTHGQCFAVLNMANAYVPGGAYVEGAIAQEENMFRRTDCHFHVGPDEFDAGRDRYRLAMTRLLSAAEGRVYLDTNHPRICIRGAEDRSAADLGYPWLAAEDVFPFYELRAAAQDLRGGSTFDVQEARRRIAAQLATLRAGGIRHAVLGAFGCGAFRNPAALVAQIYQEELLARPGDFDLIAFAIFASGYGPDNYAPFAAVFNRR